MQDVIVPVVYKANFNPFVATAFVYMISIVCNFLDIKVLKKMKCLTETCFPVCLYVSNKVIRTGMHSGYKLVN